MKKFEHELEALQKRLSTMGELAASMVTKAVGAVVRHDESIAAQVRADEEKVDALHLEIDHEAVRLLTVYGPVASSLRYILTVSHVNSALERIGDQAVNLCDDLEMMMARGHVAEIVPKIQQMAPLVIDMVTDALKALTRKDVEMAEATMMRDDLIDRQKMQIMRELLSDQFIRKALEGPEDMSNVLAQILIARALERIADQACNICEEVVYMVEGKDIRHSHADKPHSIGAEREG